MFKRKCPHPGWQSQELSLPSVIGVNARVALEGPRGGPRVAWSLWRCVRCGEERMHV